MHPRSRDPTSPPPPGLPDNLRSGIVLLALIAAACRDSSAPVAPPPRVPTVDLGGGDVGIASVITTKPLLMHVPTRDSVGVLIPWDSGGGEAVHPSVSCAD